MGTEVSKASFELTEEEKAYHVAKGRAFTEEHGQAFVRMVRDNYLHKRAIEIAEAKGKADQVSDLGKKSRIVKLTMRKPGSKIAFRASAERAQADVLSSAIPGEGMMRASERQVVESSEPGNVSGQDASTTPHDHNNCPQEHTSLTSEHENAARTPDDVPRTQQIEGAKDSQSQESNREADPDEPILDDGSDDDSVSEIPARGPWNKKKRLRDEDENEDSGTEFEPTVTSQSSEQSESVVSNHWNQNDGARTNDGVMMNEKKGNEELNNKDRIVEPGLAPASLPAASAQSSTEQAVEGHGSDMAVIDQPLPAGVPNHDGIFVADGQEDLESDDISAILQRNALEAVKMVAGGQSDEEEDLPLEVIRARRLRLRQQMQEAEEDELPRSHIPESHIQSNGSILTLPAAPTQRERSARIEDWITAQARALDSPSPAPLPPPAPLPAPLPTRSSVTRDRATRVTDQIDSTAAIGGTAIEVTGEKVVIDLTMDDD